VRVAIVASCLLLTARALAYPFLAPRPVPSAIAGPADAHVAAVFYNPAALGPLRGLHLHIDGGARLEEGTITRDGGAGSAAINWANPDAFVGLSWDLNTDAFTVGLAVFAPFTDMTSYGQSPVRYHAINHTMFILEESIAAAFRVTNRFYIGAAANFAEGWLDYRFDRNGSLDPCPPQPTNPCSVTTEDPATAQQLRLRGFGWGIGFSVGVLVRPVDRLWIGLSYVSHIFNPGPGSDFPLTDTSKRGTFNFVPANPPTSTGAYVFGNDRVSHSVPDILMLGIRGEITSRVELEGQARWVHYGNRPVVEVELQSADVQRLGLPASFFIDRGLQDAWGLEFSTRWKIKDRLRLSPSLFYESSAVDSRKVDAANIDAHKIDLALTLEYKPVRHLVLGLNLGVTIFFLQHAGDAFDPQKQVDCQSAQYALDACQAVNSGDALPKASGNYTLVVPHAGGSIGMEF
jgi:long-subunit fatty acid transport protein